MQAKLQKWDMVDDFIKSVVRGQKPINTYRDTLNMVEHHTGSRKKSIRKIRLLLEQYLKEDVETISHVLIPFKDMEIGMNNDNDASGAIVSVVNLYERFESIARKVSIVLQPLNTKVYFMDNKIYVFEKIIKKIFYRTICENKNALSNTISIFLLEQNKKNSDLLTNSRSCESITTANVLKTDDATGRIGSNIDGSQDKDFLNAVSKLFEILKQFGLKKYF